MEALDVTLKEAEAHPVAAVRDVFDEYEDIFDLFDELEAWLAAVGVAPLGPRLALFYDTKEGDGDLEGAATRAIPAGTDAEPPEDERVMIDMVPAAERLACLRYDGPTEGLDRPYEALLAWAEANGYRAVGPRRVLFGDEFVEVQLPVAQG